MPKKYKKEEDLKRSRSVQKVQAGPIGGKPKKDKKPKKDRERGERHGQGKGKSND